jgi:hypothetical protein
MPKPAIKPNDDRGDFGVIAVTAFPGGRFLQTIRVNFTSRSAAYAQCDRLQDDLDKDGDPARAYVVDRDGIPIRAGLPAHYPSNYFFAVQPRRSRAA